MRFYPIFAALFLVSCISTSALIPVQYELIDDPGQARVELRYRNDSDHTMCLLPEHWPNAAGKIHSASDTVFLIVGGQRFPIEEFNTGYCPQGCATRVAPGEEVIAFIPYSDFDLPESFRNKPKELQFSPKAFRCEPQR